MPTLNVKDERVYALASELARVRGTSMTAVIREALEHELAAAHAVRVGLADWLLELGASTALLLAHLPADPSADLYDDETGAPR